MKLNRRRDLFVFLVRRGPIHLTLGLTFGLILCSIHLLWGGAKATALQSSLKNKSKQPKITRWLLEDSLFFQKGTLGTITGMAFLPGGSDSQASIVVTGQYGAAHFSDKREFYSNVKLEHKGFRMVPVNLKGEGGFTFMNRGGDGQQVGLFDSQGRLAWRYGLGVDPAPNDMTAGDLDGDGLPEFAVGMNGAGGVRLLDRNGKEKWRQPDVYVWHVEILDIDGDGKNEIVHSNVDGRVRIRDADGKLIREISNKSFVASFNICRWPSDTSRWGLLNNHALEGIQLFDFAGHLVTTFEAPIKGLRVFGTPVQLSTTEKTCFALLICDCIPRHDSWLYLYDADGNIVFEKRFLTSQASLLTIPDERPGIERLLVGEAEGQVWQLRLKPEEPVRED